MIWRKRSKNVFDSTKINHYIMVCGCMAGFGGITISSVSASSICFISSLNFVLSISLSCLPYIPHIAFSLLSLSLIYRISLLLLISHHCFFVLLHCFPLGRLCTSTTVPAFFLLDCFPHLFSPFEYDIYMRGQYAHIFFFLAKFEFQSFWALRIPWKTHPAYLKNGQASLQPQWLCRTPSVLFMHYKDLAKITLC